MNCLECQENLVAYLECVLDKSEALACREHLDACSSCRRECDALTRLQQRLATRGQVAARVSVVGRVMGRIRDTQSERSSSIHMIKTLLRWGLGAGAIAGVALVAVVLFSAKGQALASEVMAKGALAAKRLTSVHLQCRVRTAPGENFAHIDPSMDFVKVDLWKDCRRPSKWRVDKPGRVAVMDGQSTTLYLRAANAALKVPQPSAAAFDTGWLHELADIEQTLGAEMRLAQSKGSSLELSRETDASGAAKAVVTLETQSGLPDGDYLKNAFFNTADTRRVYRFDEPSGQLEALQVFLHTPSGDVLVMEVDRIEYNPTLDPGLFDLALPQNVNWIEEPKPAPDDPQAAAMTAEQAARAFFEACGREDWTEVSKYWPLPIDDRFKAFLSGVKVLQLGDSFTSTANDARFVPYEIQFKDGNVKKFNLALKRNGPGKRWTIDGGL
ncbi:MAG TPA: hypothetical protein P5186_15495 [Candidatus Paceibacterota bacterium]|nr:hypothetical protein [Candidatus Paceibacterota bacterium]